MWLLLLLCLRASVGAGKLLREVPIYHKNPRQQRQLKTTWMHGICNELARERINILATLVIECVLHALF